MANTQYLEFKDEFQREIIIEDQKTELYISIEDQSFYMDKDQFEQFKIFINSINIEK